MAVLFGAALLWLWSRLHGESGTLVDFANDFLENFHHQIFFLLGLLSLGDLSFEVGRAGSYLNG